MTPVLIVLNAGSSSLKFQVFDMLDGGEAAARLERSLRGAGRGWRRFLVKDTGGAFWTKGPGAR